MEENGQRLTVREIVGMGSMLLAAGSLPTTDLCNGVLTLLRRPDELAKLGADPSLSKNAVQELLLFENTVVQAMRILGCYLVLPEATIPVGQTVVLTCRRSAGMAELPRVSSGRDAAGPD
ncbi:MAG TPA: hypothetical protein VK539_32235 [Myxococcaceae bacterium]|nr:hypothetical protein [Myxococcaceae bacterium]